MEPFVCLSGLSIGMRFRSNYGLDDKIGEILDNILFSKKTYFNPDVFPYTSKGPGDNKLYNLETKDYLQITSNDIILDINFSEYNGFAKDQMNEIISEYESSILKSIKDIYAVKDIFRLGIIKKHLFNNDQFNKKVFTSNMIDDVSGVDEYSISFQKRMPKIESLTNKEINDYRNAIFNAKKKPGSDGLIVTIDYQNYFDPTITDISDLEYRTFISDADKYYNSSFKNWVDTKIVGEKK